MTSISVDGLLTLMRPEKLKLFKYDILFDLIIKLHSIDQNSAKMYSCSKLN